MVRFAVLRQRIIMAPNNRWNKIAREMMTYRLFVKRHNAPLVVKKCKILICRPKILHLILTLWLNANCGVKEFSCNLHKIGFRAHKSGKLIFYILKFYLLSPAFVRALVLWVDAREVWDDDGNGEGDYQNTTQWTHRPKNLSSHRCRNHISISEF